ncbi:hypothetical protein BDR26DRAFT_864155 [Obelidium mucronatum]|nr:hypothetical protein BDR26DRAFT_864155 [Obelidium mucronatum]
MALNYAGKDGFTPPISDQDSVDYINWLTGTVHDLNLAVASKNGGLFYATHPELVSKFDFAVVEECAASGNCNLYDVFVKAGKPVFAADYKDKGKDGGCKPITGTVAEACAVLNSHNFEGIIKSCGLGATVVQCRGPNANIEQGKGSSGSSDSGNGSSGGISFGVSVAVYVFAAFLAL